MGVRETKKPGRVAYVNARLLDPASGLDAVGGLLTDGETIEDFGPGLFGDGAPDDASVVDCQGFCLAPGLVDMRAQLDEPAGEQTRSIASAGRSAVAGGITMIACLPNAVPVIDDMSVVEFVARRARKAGLAKVFAYAALTKGLEGNELAELGLLAESGAVAFTDGTSALKNSQVMRRALSYASTFDLLIVQHPEDPDLAGGGDMNSGETATRLGLSGIPAVAEVIMVERDIRLAELTGGRIHFAHVSTAAAVDVIAAAKAKGLSVTCDTAPPYFSLNETAVGDYRTFAKLSPPLRSEDDRQAIVEGLKSGVIDAIASDHSPRHEDAKRLPFAQATFGGVGLETLLALTLDLYHNSHMDLLAALHLITDAPAAVLGLSGGRLERGAAADLVLFDPDRGWKVEADTLISVSKNTPFDERPVQGRVLRTIVDGRCVFEFGG